LAGLEEAAIPALDLSAFKQSLLTKQLKKLIHVDKQTWLQAQKFPDTLRYVLENSINSVEASLKTKDLIMWNE
jgi:hypothetical protein